MWISNIQNRGEMVIIYQRTIYVVKRNENNECILTSSDNTDSVTVIGSVRTELDFRASLYHITIDAKTEEQPTIVINFTEKDKFVRALDGLEYLGAPVMMIPRELDSVDVDGNKMTVKDSLLGRSVIFTYKRP